MSNHLDFRFNLGISGTGYISRNFYNAFHNHKQFKIQKVLTRRQTKFCHDYPEQHILTNSIDDLIEKSDCIYECSGDPIHAAAVIAKALLANKPVLTTNTEFHVTCGSYFVDKGLISEAAGDQPGALAQLHHRASNMGFKTLAYVNMKGFLNHNPKPEEMHYWANRNGISLQSVTSFTDGTKIQFEQALVANAFNATFAKPGMLGLEEQDPNIIRDIFASTALKLDQPISDYVIYPNAPHGVFIIMQHHARETDMLRYVKMGTGPYYTLQQNAILLHLEVPETLFDLLFHKKILLNNSQLPSIQVAAIAKKPLKKGDQIEQALGGFDIRGEGMKIIDNPDILPIGLSQGARLLHDIEPGQTLMLDDVELPDSMAKQAWFATREKLQQKQLAL